MSITERIKALADQQNRTFASIERDIGLGRGAIRRWDENIPSADKVLKVANLLQVTVDYLLTGKNKNANLISKDEFEQKALSAFRQLNEDNKDIIIGKMKELLKEQKCEESVAADFNIKEAK